GHVRGAFTGAIEDRKGYFERAAGGTLLLDEIGELPLTLQVKLLRVLEQREFTRVGDHRPIAANFRIIAATNQDLRDAVQRGEFREDLYHRLAGMLIYLPPLRERDGDVPLLCSYFLRKLARDRKVDLTLSEDFVADLNKRPWHGNVRELRNACEHAVIIARGRQLTIDDFPKSQPGRSVSSESTVPAPSNVVQRWASEQLGNEAIRGKLHSEFLADFESQLFKAVLAFTNGNRVQAAQWLGLNRATLRERLKNYAND
ncbi:MAG: sigma 54-interacting transcriptional regulator, partial [Planctomycetota bacterium]